MHNTPLALLSPPPPHPEELARVRAIEELQLLDRHTDLGFDRVVRLARNVLGTPITAFTVVHGQCLHFRAATGTDLLEAPRDTAFCAYTILGEGLQEVPDLLADPRFQSNPMVIGEPGLRYYAGIAVRAPDGSPVGALCAIDHNPRQLSADQRTALVDLRNLLEENLALRLLSLRDHLTGLYNRRYFDEVLKREWSRAYRRLLPLSVLILDVDHFKRYNDQYGHVAGDQCLIELSRALAPQTRRASDLVARYGGEELVLVLPETDLDGAVAVANQIRRAVERLAIPHAGSPSGIVTVSVGGAVATSKEDLLLGDNALLARADEALYEAKRSGRNATRVVTL
ncbi:MAG TPA: sensor domain-containing diguanylate cyclase [Nevskiaceae bacterium]|nr:sensor domain-containing diguanylate cyclase [Nevskiaceae bacterium]